ncbi:MAG: DUF1501 domain-containing protein [Phycisphaerales bacterium]|nr:DUF1501 domain-containing protein [Phycisphaerales bacterium]
MSSADHAPFSRRLFIRQGLTLASLAATVPQFIQDSALGMMLPLDALTSSRPGVPEDRVLVIVQLAGGNDGLNTVVPYGDRNYYNYRPAIGIGEPGRNGQAALELDQGQGIGLHPSMASFKSLVDEGVAAVVQGVGYPNPNRSHFASTDIWETARLDGKGTGWVGRYFDCTCNGTPVPEGAVAIGRNAPLALQGEIQKPVSFESADLFRWLGKDMHPALEQPYASATRAGVLPEVDEHSQAAFLMRTALDAQVSSDRIRAAVAKAPLVQYPQGNLSRQLRTVGAMIRDGMPTRVYYVSLGGFDTHAGQAGTHANLLRQLADGLGAFHRDLKAQGNSGRVLTMVFSEFGRRVRQNASQGTDHGTAAPMFLVGDMVKPGVLGTHPSLTDLDGGDLKFTVDFRSVYAGVLDDWMGADAAKVLGKGVKKAVVVRS